MSIYQEHEKQVKIRTIILLIPSMIISYYSFEYANMFQIIDEPFGLFIAVGLVLVFAYSLSRVFTALSMMRLR